MQNRWEMSVQKRKPQGKLLEDLAKEMKAEV